MEARTSTIKATNRMSVKIENNFYTVEWCEERVIPEGMSEEEVKQARSDLWDTCVQECENQIADINRVYGRSGKSGQ